MTAPEPAPDSSANDPSAPSKPASRPRWLRRIAAVVFVLALLVIGAVFVVLNSLGSPTVRGFITDEVAAQTGIHVTWQDLEVGASGLELTGFGVLPPSEDAPIVKRVLEVASTRVSWDLGALLDGAVVVPELVVRGVKLHAVIDADGSSTFSRLMAGLPKSDKPAQPPPALSDLPGVVAALPAARVDKLSIEVSEVTASLRGPSGRHRDLAIANAMLGCKVDVGGGRSDARCDIKSMGDKSKVSIGPDANFSVPTRTAAAAEIARYLRRGFDSSVAFDVMMALGPASAAFTASATRLPRFVIGRRARAHAAEISVTAAFEPANNRTRLKIDKTALFDDLATMALDATVHDKAGGGVTVDISTARADMDFAPLAPALPTVFGKLSVTTCSGGVTVAGVKGLGSKRMPAVSQVDLRADVGDLHYRLADYRGAIDSGRMRMTVRPGHERTLAISAKAHAGEVVVSDSGRKLGATMRDLDAKMAATEVRYDPIDVLSSQAEATVDVLVHHLDAVSAAGAVTLTDAQPSMILALGARRLNVQASVPAKRFTADAKAAHLDALDLATTMTVTELPLRLDHGLGKSRIAVGFTASTVKGSGAGRTAVVKGATAEASASGIAVPPASPLYAIGAAAFEASARHTSIGGFGSISALSANGKARVLKVDPKRPLAATGHIDGHARIGKAQLGLKVDRDARPIHWDASAHIPALGKLISGLALPRKVRKMALWDRLAFDATSTGSWTQGKGKAPWRVEHKEAATVSGLVATIGELRATLPVAKMKLEGQGAGLKHDLRLVGDIANPRVAGYSGAGNHSIKGRVTFDLGRPEGSYEIDVKATAGPAIHSTGSARLYGNRLDLKIGGQAARLGMIARALPADLKRKLCIDLGRFSGRFDAKGYVNATRRRLLDGSAAKAWSAGKLPDSRFDATASGANAHCKTKKMLAALKSFDATATVSSKARNVTLDATFSTPKLRFEMNELYGELRKLGGKMRVTSARLAKPGGKTKLSMSAKVGFMAQNSMPGYRIADARFELDAAHVHGTDIHIDRMLFDNPVGGTRFEANGGIQLPGISAGATAADGTSQRVAGRHALAWVGRVTQDVGKFAEADKRLTGSGNVTIPFRLESGDLSVIRTTASIQLDNVSVGVPQLEAEVRAISGNVPILEDIEWSDEGIQLLGGGANNAYARWRFADQHPFLGGDHFVSAKEFVFRGEKIGPIAGNAEIDRNVLHVDQLEMQVAGGKVTGQCIIDVNGADTELLFRGNVTGVRAGEARERLDAHAAIAFKPAKMSLIGRAELLRLGRAHVRTALDLWDPYREDDRANKMRLALKAGYPKRMRVRFTHGFADFLIELGGLGSLVKIDEIRGITLGPALVRYLGPFIKKTEKLLEGTL